MIIEKCELCARKCGAERRENEESNGFCRLPSNPHICRSELHFYEEPNISGKNGSGAIFFSGCVMRCEFCQNYEISRASKGRALDEYSLVETMKALEKKGAHNINFVSPAPFAPVIKRALEIYKPNIPTVYNCSGYESAEAIHMLEGLIDVYLPDFKYSDNALSIKLSHAPNYVENALRAIGEMYRQKPSPVHGEDGMVKSGVMIRHLILPGAVENSKGVLKLIRDNFGSGAFISLMAQFTPNGQSDIPELKRKITEDEYDEVFDYMLELGFENGFVQELDSADMRYVPEWTLQT